MPSALGNPCVLRNYGSGVLLNLHRGRFLKGVFWAGIGCIFRACPASSGNGTYLFLDDLTDRRWNHCRRGGNPYLSSQYLYSLPCPGLFGGQRLYVESGLRDEWNHGDGWAFRSGIFAHAFRFWLYRPGGNGDQGIRKSKGQKEDDFNYALYVLFCPSADLCAFCRYVFPGQCPPGRLFPVSGRYGDGDPDCLFCL